VDLLRCPRAVRRSLPGGAHVSSVRSHRWQSGAAELGSLFFFGNVRCSNVHCRATIALNEKKRYVVICQISHMYSYVIIWLEVWNHEFYSIFPYVSHHIGESHHPNWRTIFSQPVMVFWRSGWARHKLPSFDAKTMAGFLKKANTQSVQGNQS